MLSESTKQILDQHTLRYRPVETTEVCGRCESPLNAVHCDDNGLTWLYCQTCGKCGLTPHEINNDCEPEGMDYLMCRWYGIPYYE